LEISSFLNQNLQIHLLKPVRQRRGQSIAKRDNQGIIPNEDHFRLENPIAVSDGAGGAGLFTGEWAEYLCDHLPDDSISTFEEFSGWINSIWEPFCNKYQKVAEERGIGAKFLSEGSWATLVAVWLPDFINQNLRWLAYGDSAIFVFDLEAKSLDFCSVKDINLYTESPYLINWKEDPTPLGFSNGEFILKKNQIVLLASDAISQYILLRYLLHQNSESAKLQLVQLEESGSRLSVQMAKMRTASHSADFFSVTLQELIESLCSFESFQSLTDKLKQQGLLAFDDYTLLIYC
jgi:hypothetical protein